MSKKSFSVGRFFWAVLNCIVWAINISLALLIASLLMTTQLSAETLHFLVVPSWAVAGVAFMVCIIASMERRDAEIDLRPSVSFFEVLVPALSVIAGVGLPENSERDAQRRRREEAEQRRRASAQRRLRFWDGVSAVAAIGLLLGAAVAISCGLWPWFVSVVAA